MKHCQACKTATAGKWKYYSREKGTDGLLHAVVVDSKYNRVNLCVLNAAKSTPKGA